MALGIPFDRALDMSPDDLYTWIIGLSREWGREFDYDTMAFVDEEEAPEDED